MNEHVNWTISHRGLNNAKYDMKVQTVIVNSLTKKQRNMALENYAMVWDRNKTRGGVKLFNGFSLLTLFCLLDLNDNIQIQILYWIKHSKLHVFA